MPGPKVKRVLKWIGGVFATIVLLIAVAAWYFLPVGPLLDDGPFHGTLTAAINGRQPDQSISIWSGKTLEVFDATTERISATVQLRRAYGSVQWAILADGHSSGDVRSVRFTNADRGRARSGTVYGWVDWTYGHEATY